LRYDMKIRETRTQNPDEVNALKMVESDKQRSGVRAVERCKAMNRFYFCVVVEQKI
jgi:hypothetical protein